MKNEIHFFDLDQTLWSVKSDVWLIDKENPYKPLMTIPSKEFSLIRKGIYRNHNIPVSYNGETYFISKFMYSTATRKMKSENISRLGVSFIGLYGKEELKKSEVDYMMGNISHLIGKDVTIGILTARSNQRTHSDLLNDLRLELKNMRISIDKIYFVGDKFTFSKTEEYSIKKLYILLEHLIGFNIKDGRFINTKQDWFTDVHFYDDTHINIDYANNAQNTLNEILKRTDDELFKIIVERINTNNLNLHTHMITNNELNRFEDNSIKIVEPNNRFKYLKTYDSYKYFENIDPFEEEWESEEPYTEFENWLLTQYPDDNVWSEIKVHNCSNNNLTSLKGIENLTNLEILYCSDNNLTSLEGIENLTNLEVLYCSHNNLTSLKGIENLRNLERLYCYDNNLTSLKGIENLRNIKVLSCYDNNLTSLEGIENLTNLKYLYCYHNNLTSLEGIENLSNLKYLYCSNNNLTSLKGIKNLMNLKELFCSYNNLTSLEGIENLSNLERLSCPNNNFSKEYKQYLRNYCVENKIYLNI